MRKHFPHQIHCLRKAALLALGLVALSAIRSLDGAEGPVAAELLDVTGRIDVRRFADRVQDGDWSPAIQAAIDAVREEDGFTAGATIFFPPGTYRVDRTLILGGDRAHGGLHLLGYGATLLGSVALDGQPLPYDEPEPEEKEAGVPILLLRKPPGVEWADYVIEGLRFSRQQKNGCAIAVPWNDVPKQTSFRRAIVQGQKIGVHIPYAWQFSFTDCSFRGNDIGMQIRSHGNHINIAGCEFRRNHYHGLVIGPDRGQWASNVQHISGCIFEANKGYGVLLRSSAQTVLTGNYFEGNGTSIGVYTPWEVTIDTNLFWGYYGHGWRHSRFPDNAHIVVSGCQRLHLRNNRYAAVTAWFRRPEEGTRWEYVPRPPGPEGVETKKPAPPEQEPGFVYEERPVSVLIDGTFGGRYVFDTAPEIGPQGKIKTTRMIRDTGLEYYEYHPESNRFELKSLLDDRKALDDDFRGDDNSG